MSDWLGLSCVTEGNGAEWHRQSLQENYGVSSTLSFWLGVKQLRGLYSIALMTLRVIEGRDAFITGMPKERDGKDSVDMASHN
ncbi:uncharacterized [Tachysurus ichikawai]